MGKELKVIFCFYFCANSHLFAIHGEMCQTITNVEEKDDDDDFVDR